MNQKLSQLHDKLNITSELLADRDIEIFEEVSLGSLIVNSIDPYGRPLCLEQKTSIAWNKLKQAASNDNIELIAFSGFRSYAYQANLIQERLDQGRELEEILTNVAAPGYSEHHTGRALDITSHAAEVLSESFENTDAFKWLVENAKSFGFILSFPKNNPQGYIYEPWHWCYQV